MSIWQHTHIKQVLESIALRENKEDYAFCTLDEGNTPIDGALVDGLQLDIKREDHNPTGSYKDRGTAFKISELKLLGHNEAVISSSGNAAISFLKYGSFFGVKIHVVMSPNASPKKLELIKELTSGNIHELHLATKARNLAAQIAAEKQIVNLRASTDSHIIAGYESIAYECEQEYTDVFVPTSSGTALVGIYNGFVNNGKSVAMHACQTSHIHPIAVQFDDNYEEEESSLADAIVDRSAIRREQVAKILRDNNGNGWIISNQELSRVFELVNSQLQHPVSYTSALSIAGALKAHQTGKVGEKVLCIASGR